MKRIPMQPVPPEQECVSLRVERSRFLPEKELVSLLQRFRELQLQRDAGLIGGARAAQFGSVQHF